MRYFNYWEFDSPDKKDTGKLMNATLLSMLDEARHIAQIPFKINSGYRTTKRNMQVGGKINSSHLKGLAVDISCTDSRSRSIILSALKDVSFNRVGIAKSFIHVDIDDTKSANVTWVY